MIFNTATPAAGGGSSSWTDVSSDFENALDAVGFGAVNAYTNGSTVWLYVLDLMPSGAEFDLPSGYMPLSDVVFPAYATSDEPVDDVTASMCVLTPSTSGHPNGTLSLPEPSNYNYTFTIIYPIA